MEIIFEKNKDLSTTFGIPAKTKFFAEYSSVNELKKIAASEEFRNNEVFHIGGGSNLVFINDFQGLVLHSAIKGITRYDKNDETSFVISGAAEKWDDLVKWTVDQGLQGLECLAGIPGEVGAAAVQNIGAYGSEVSNSLFNVECYDTIENKIVTIKNEECQYSYRNSLFKNEGKGRFIVLRVSFKLKRSDKAAENIDRVLPFLKNASNLTISDIYREIIHIRESKLPDPKILGNAGSFFKNPVIHWYYFEDVVKSKCPGLPSYPTDNKYFVKISAAKLIEESGLKGYRIGGAEVYSGHCLVIVNVGNATGEDVRKLSNHVIQTVKDKFGVVLQPEVNMIDSGIEVTFLGTGTSKGMPEVGCYCSVCKSTDKKDQRMRSSVLVETNGVNILIDASPDFRKQALDNDINRIDAILLTHSHYDHVGGIDDLRPFCSTSKLPVYLKEDVNNDLRRRIDYCFKEELYPGVPSFETYLIDNLPFLVKGIKIIPITVYHGRLPILGYRIGDFAYVTDAKTIPESEMEKLEGLKVLVLNTLREREHFAHFSLGEALKIIEELKPERAYLTHFCHEIGLHYDFQAKLPPNVFAAFDGLKVKID